MKGRKMGTPLFTKVVHHAERVAIVGTGASIKETKLVLQDNVRLLAVNSAIYYHKDIDFWFTLDPSPSNMEIMKTRFFGIAYYAAVPDDFRVVSDHVRHLRRITGLGHGRYRTKGGLSRDKGCIHTGNSAWGALQLAVHMGAKKVALFGIDGHGDYHYGGSPRNLTMMPELFASSVGELKELGVEVINGSPSSVVDCFPRVTPTEAMQWINGGTDEQV